MSTSKSVLGVLTVCWAVFGDLTQHSGPKTGACGGVCWVCWVYARRRACAQNISPLSVARIFFHANPEKPNKPNTLNTTFINHLICMVFLCVGFVLGISFFVLGLVLRGIGA
jgi:hypothetical protein